MDEAEMEEKPSIIKLNMSKIETSEKGGWRSLHKRQVLMIYAFFGFFLTYALRVNLSVAIVDMVKDHSKPLVNEGVNGTSDGTLVEEWSTVLQGYILSSFFYGYIVTQLPAAFLTTKYGGKMFFGGGIGICSFLALLTPAAAHIGPTCLIFLRTLQGLFQGFIYTSMHAMWSKWAPPTERSKMATFAFSGSYIGSVVALSVGGLLAENVNWQSIFYVSGSAGIIWTILWFHFISESPASHETISFDERDYIEQSYIQNDNEKNIPWCQILRSKAVWAVVIAHSAENWGIYTMLTEMPTFLSEIMGFKMDKAGFYSALPYLIMAFVLYFIGYASDLMHKENKFSLTFIRKLFCCSGLLSQSFFMLIMIMSTNSVEIVICLMLAVGFGGMTWASFGVNHLDIGAGYANVLMAISNTFATIPGIISPILTGHIIVNKTKSEWNTVFWISTIIYVTGAITYGLIGSGETQYWAFTTPTASFTTNEFEHVGDNSFEDDEIGAMKKAAQRKDEAQKPLASGQVNTSYSAIEH